MRGNIGDRDTRLAHLVKMGHLHGTKDARVRGLNNIKMPYEAKKGDTYEYQSLHPE